MDKPKEPENTRYKDGYSINKINIEYLLVSLSIMLISGGCFGYVVTKDLVDSKDVMLLVISMGVGFLLSKN